MEPNSKYLRLCGPKRQNWGYYLGAVLCLVAQPCLTLCNPMDHTCQALWKCQKTKKSTKKKVKLPEMPKPSENISVTLLLGSTAGFSHWTVCPRHLCGSISIDQTGGTQSLEPQEPKWERAYGQEMCFPRYVHRIWQIKSQLPLFSFSGHQGPGSIEMGGQWKWQRLPRLPSPFAHVHIPQTTPSAPIRPALLPP